MKCGKNFCFPICSLIFLTSGNKWSPKHELRLSRERHNVLPSWWLWENHSRWASHHKVSPLVWMDTVRQKQTDIHDAWWRNPFANLISILKHFPLTNLLLLSVLKLVGGLGSDVQSLIVKDFSMVTHRNSNVRAVLFSDSSLILWARLIPSGLRLLQPTQQVSVTSSGRTVKRRVHQLDDDPDREVLFLSSSCGVLKLFARAMLEELGLMWSLFMTARQTGLPVYGDS